MKTTEVASKELALVSVKEVKVSDNLVVEPKKVALTWQEIDARIAILKQEAKALKMLTGAKIGSSAKNPEEKLKVLKEKWNAKSPKGSQLLGEMVTFRPFGSDKEALEGVLFSMVEDKRVPTILLKIRVGEVIYHKDHKSINSEVIWLHDGNMEEI